MTSAWAKVSLVALKVGREDESWIGAAVDGGFGRARLADIVAVMGVIQEQSDGPYRAVSYLGGDGGRMLVAAQKNAQTSTRKTNFFLAKSGVRSSVFL